ncbi:MAG TPA: dihydrofolate reductase [Acidimicrobiia bacterium]|jgi:D-3-phosphoglycerate dehydrogenase / 2-oxoglutarate reductase|nr:dihydrofolate reductase [Acidimicrobiia bacterium]
MKIAVTCIQLIRDIEAYLPSLEAAGFEVALPEISGQHLEGAELVAALDGCVGVVAGDDQFTAEVLDQSPNLKAISKWGIGVDGIDKGAAAQRGIPVTNTPGAFDDEVADVTMAYCVLLLRQLHAVDQGIRNGQWPKPAGRSLGEKTIGVIGLGGIGRAVVRRAVTAGMTVLGSDPSSESQQLAAELGAQVVPFEELMQRSDIVSVNCPLNPSTYHLINDEHLELMKPGGWLVNVGRGAVVETPALVRALQSGILAGAAVDVLEEEPPASDDPIRGLSNVIFGSHNASNTLEASARVHVRALKNLAKELGVELEL